MLALNIILSIYIIFASSDNEDLVTSIPYYTGNKVNFKTYSGYLNGESGALFYLFTESSSDNPSNDPLVLWLNGGPGCSSLMGQFIEFGPYHPYNYGNNIEYNLFSWNSFANILFLESPPCVGFSYPFSKNCHNYETNDNQTKWDNYLALKHFFIKYPQFINNKFMITGESYAGHYVPQLAELIMDQKVNYNDNNFNLEQIAIGNPYINRNNNWFKGWVPTMYNFGIINDKQRDKLLNSNGCNQNNDIFNNKCSEYAWKFIDDYLSDINVYDVNVDSNCSIKSRQETELLRHIYSSPNNKYINNINNGYIWSYPYTPCNENNLVYYLNSEDVWNAFHVNKEWMNSNGNINNKTWQICSWYFNGYDKNQTDDKYDQIYFIKNLLNKYNNYIKHILVYSGNNDLVCSYSSTRYWIYNKLNQTDRGQIITNWTKWHINNNNNEVGGWYQSWQKLTFMVVKDAGHEVPEYQPIRAYSLFQKFLNNNYYNDISLNIKHLNWNNYPNTQNNKSNDSLSIGIIIGISISFLLLLFFIGFLWIKKYCLQKSIVQEKNNVHIILEEVAN